MNTWLTYLGFGALTAFGLLLKAGSPFTWNMYTSSSRVVVWRDPAGEFSTPAEVAAVFGLSCDTHDLTVRSLRDVVASGPCTEELHGILINDRGGFSFRTKESRIFVTSIGTRDQTLAHVLERCR